MKTTAIMEDESFTPILFEIERRILAAVHSAAAGGARRILPTQLWTQSLRTIEESIQRRSSGPGSKDYQKFLQSFLPAATSGPTADTSNIGSRSIVVPNASSTDH